MRIRQNIELKNMTTFKIGGCAAYYCEPECDDDFIQINKFASDKGVRVIVLGGGANMLFPDHKLDALVVSMAKLKRMSVCGDEAVFGAGVSVDRAIRFLIRRSLAGMEFAGGLPGSVGGGVYMNARCYGSEFADILKSVKVIDKENKIRVLSKAEIGYGYKNSIFMKEEGLFILECTFILQRKDKNLIKADYLKNVNDRKSKGQFSYPSAGCIFKNDYNVGISSGKLIDDAGLKGRSVGGAAVYEKHANFIVNKKNASSADVKALIKIVQDEVYKSKGVMLDPEVRIIE